MLLLFFASSTIGEASSSSRQAIDDNNDIHIIIHNCKNDDRQTPPKIPLRGVVFDMDGTLTVPNLDFDEMYRRAGLVMGKDDILSPKHRTFRKTGVNTTNV